VIPRFNALLSPLVRPRQLGVNASLNQSARGTLKYILVFQVAIFEQILADQTEDGSFFPFPSQARIQPGVRRDCRIRDTIDEVNG
jgi:hypothetical protein